MRTARRIRSARCAALLLLACVADVAPAVEVPRTHADPRDVKLLDQCFGPAPSATERRACIGRLATPCRDAPDGQTTIGTRACLERELLAWRELRDRYRSRLLDGADARRRELVNVTEAVWQSRTSGYCAWPNHLLSGGTIAAPLILECQMTSTALETVDLAEMAEWLH